MLLRVAPLLLLVAVAGQAAPPQAPQPPPVVFRSGVELVRLDVRVVDASGRPVKDLRPEEVVITEAGVSRPVVLFQHVAEPSGTYVEVARRTIGAEVSTNQGAPRGHLYVLVFDQNHITPGNEQRVRAAAQRFLDTRVHPGDRVALYALPGPGPQIAFSSNARAVAAELVKIRGELDRAGTSGVSGMTTYEAFQIVRGNSTLRDTVAARIGENGGSVDFSPTRPGVATTGAGSAVNDSPLMTDAVLLSAARTAVGVADSDARVFLTALSDVIRRLGNIEGRKSVILLSEGFYSDNLTGEIEQVAAAAAQAHAVIYSLDLNRRGIDVNADQPTGGAAAAEVQSRLEPLGTLAADTDGALVLDAVSRIDSALNQVADTSQDYYLLGFEPTAEAQATRDRYHRVKVQVSRSGASVHARSGYSLPDPSRRLDRRAAIDFALAAPFPQAGVPVEVTTYVMRGAVRGVHRVMMSLQADVPLRSADATRADVVFVVKNAADGRVVNSGTDTVALPATARAGGTTGLSRFQVQFDAPPGDYLMRVVVREPGGALGTADRRFTVRALDGVDVSASDLVIGPKTGVLPVRAAVRPSDGINAVLEIYARRPADLDRVDVKVALTRVGADAPVVSAPASLLPVISLAGGASRGAQIDMPVNGVPPGEYVVRATVRASGETVAELSREVEILAPGARADVETKVGEERVRPADILSGDLGRRLLAALRGSATDRNVLAAATSATSGHWEKTESALRGATPGFVVQTLRGLAMFASERMDVAATELSAALDQPPTAGAGAEDKTVRAQTAFLLGWAYSYSGNDAQAISAWRNATVLDPTLVAAYLALADAYVHRSDPALAGQVLRAGLVALPNSYELKQKLQQVDK
jgi:VWFA-related protein